MQRILVTGITGAGKTTLARGRCGRDQRRAGLGLRFSGIPAVRDLLWTRADGIVWLDYPRRVVMSRVLRRSAARTLRRQRVFGGNVETVRFWFTRDHPAWWAWTQYEARRAEIAARCERFGPLEVVRLGSPRAARRWLAALPSARTVLDQAGLWPWAGLAAKIRS